MVTSHGSDVARALGARMKHALLAPMRAWKHKNRHSYSCIAATFSFLLRSWSSSVFGNGISVSGPWSRPFFTSMAFSGQNPSGQRLPTLRGL